MDTRRLKPFAQECRQRLMQGVAERMHYWGFVPASRQPVEPLEKLDGGYLFRGQVFDETDVPRRWQMLAGAVQTHGFAHVQETVAYTWFNRLMALKILANNNYQSGLPVADVLAFSRPGTPTPVLLDEARRAHPPYLSAQLYGVLRPLLTDYTRETDAFARLLTAYCTQHPVLHRLFDGADDVASGMPAALLLPADILGDTGLLAFINTSTAISEEDYKQVELIGWLYQFYIAERKDEVFAKFKKGQKAGPDDIPAATQIFTPRWIVSYLVENTLGRLYLDAHPDSALGNTMRYLVKNETVKQPTGEAAASTLLPVAQGGPPLREGATTAMGSLDSLRLIDPACGSGHILVTAFDLLMRIYDEEGYTKRQAVTAILTHHLVGLDLDERAAQLSRFALLLKAAQYYPAVWDTDLTPAVWAMPDPWMPTDSDLLAFLGSDGREYLAELHTALRLMQQSQNLGSVMRPDLSRAGRARIAERLSLYVNQIADPSDIFAATARQHLLHYLHVLMTLTDQYTAVAANPPYLGQGNMNDALKAYVNRQYPRSKTDLYAVFMDLSQQLSQEGGRWGMINQHSWMFLGSFEKLRRYLLDEQVLENMLHLGIGTFEEVNSKVIQSTAFIFKNEMPNSKTIGTYFRLINYKSNSQKETALLKRNNIFRSVYQIDFAKIPSEPLAYWISEKLIKSFENRFVSEYGKAVKGLDTGKDDKFLRLWWEPSLEETSLKEGTNWYPYQKGGPYRRWYGNNDYLIFWKDNGVDVKNYKDFKGKLLSRPQNTSYYFRKGVEWSRISGIAISLRITENAVFGGASSALFLKESEHIMYFLALLNSTVGGTLLKFLNPTLIYQAGDINAIPVADFDLVEDKVSKSSEQAVSLARTDWDSRETSWDFAENPLVAVQRQSPITLRQGYVAWAGQVAEQFTQLHRHEERLNRIFIDLYGLQDELIPDVSPRDITLLPEELDKNHLMAAVASDLWITSPAEAVVGALKRDVVARQLISYAVGLLMGRYRLGQPGLHIAHPNADSADLVPYEHGFGGSAPTFAIDPNGILPLLGEESGFPDELGRGLRQVLEVVWGSTQLTDTVSWLEESLGQPLDKYLTTSFWADHCRRYQKRPIYWLFSSPKGAFRVLVYLHRMNEFTVATLRNKYLLPHIDRLTRQIENLKPEPNKTASTADLRRSETLSKALVECRQYDLLLKDAADRQFCPDLDAGVVRNYAELSTVLAPIK